MIKKLIIILLLIFGSLFLFAENTCFAANAPSVNCVGLPGCVDDNIENPTKADVSNNVSLKWAGRVVGDGIKYVSVLAVITLMLSGFMYIFSGGEEEKTKKAKNWIIWSLVGVLISISAWGIINMVNNINI